MEEWKKVASQLDKDHAKGRPACKCTGGAPKHNFPPTLTSGACFYFQEYKKARADIKKKSSDTIKLQKKVKKGELVRRAFGLAVR